MGFTIRTVHHKNGKRTTKPMYDISREAKALLWVVDQRRIAEQRGILAAAKGLRTLGYPLSVAWAVLLGSERLAVQEVLREPRGQARWPF
jgi:hypothetical protein